MATGRRKCICQICTCGKHICPHRKRGIIATKGLQNGDICKQSGQSRKGENLDESEKIGGKSVSRFAHGRDGSGGIKTAKSKKVQDKGNGKNRWSAKQIPKTMAIRPPDNLKMEGSFEHTTTQQRDYTQKTLVVDESSSKQEETYQGAAINERQVPKTLPIKNQDNLKPSGSLDLRTTHGESYTDLTPVEASPKTDKGSETLNGDRKIKKSQRPKTSLRHEGSFQSETLYQKDFSPRSGAVTPKHRPVSHLKPEGTMYFEQTSSDYNADIFRTKTEDGQLLSPRPRKARPQNNLKPSVVPIADETTAGDYKKWDVEKPTRRRPEDTLKHFPTPQSADEHELLEQIKTSNYQHDAKVWNVRRPVLQRPISQLRHEGEHNFETTHHTDYIMRESEEIAAREYENVRKTSAEEQKFAEEPTSTQQVPSEQVGSLVNSEVSVMKSDSPLPDEQPTHEQYEATNVIAKDDDIALSEGSASDNMLTWDDIRQKPVRPHSNLKQQGDMKFDTTNRREFIQRPIERVKGFRPKTSTKISEDMMETTTTNQAMLMGHQGERVQPIRPKSNLHIEEGIFNDETTSAREYQQWALAKPKPIMHKSTLGQEGDMTFTTTHHTEFEPKSPEKVYHIRPKTGNKIFDQNGKFDDTTTNRVMHPAYESEKVVGIRPESNLKPNSGSFNGETTNRREFQQWDFDRMSPFRPSTNMKQEGEMDFTTMNQVQFQEKGSPRDRVQPVIHPTNLHVETGQFSDDTTTNREFQQWKLEKLTPFTPRDNLTQEGDFDGTTTNQAMFKSHPYQKLKEVRPHSNLHLETGKFENDTTTGREFHEWRYSKPSPFLPYGNLTTEGEMDFITSNQTQFGEKHIERSEGIRPHTTDMVTGDFDGMTTNRSMYKTPPLERIEQIRHEDNLRRSSGLFNGETTAGREFVQKTSDRPEPVRPKPNLSQEGEFDFLTSNQRDYEGKSMTKVSPIRPQTMTKISDGDFYGTTTNQAMFKAGISQAAKLTRPQTNIRPLSDGELHGTTTGDQYQPWKIERPAPVIYSDTLKNEGSMHFETTNRTEFVEKSMERPVPIRPKTTTKIEGDLDVTTTNQAMYSGRLQEKVQPIRQKDNLQLETGVFADETTNKREYRQWVSQKSHSRTKVVKPLKAAGIRTQGSFDGGVSNVKEPETERKISEETTEDIHETSSEGLNDMETIKQGLKEDDKETQTPEHSEKLNIDSPHADDKSVEDSSVRQTSRKQQLSRNYGSKPMARVKAFVPVGNMKQEGTIDFSTTTGKAYTEKLEQSKLDNVRFKSDYEPWQLSQDDGMNRYSIKTSDIPTRPMIHRRTTQNGMDIDSSKTAGVSYKAATIIRGPRRFKPDDNLKPENVPFNADSTTRTEYKKWDTKRSSPKKRSGMLKNEGEMQFSTTTDDYSKELFEQNGRIKPRPKKPEEHLKLSGDMNMFTTTQSVYQGNTTPKTKNLRPKSSLKIGGDPDSRTGTPPSSFRQKADLTTDITKSTYRGSVTERTRTNRPSTSQKVGEGQFESMSTTQGEYKAVKMDRTKALKPESSHIFNGGSEFQGDSTYRCAYDAAQGRRCPVLDLESNVKYRFNEEVNGHQFYLPLVIG